MPVDLLLEQRTEDGLTCCAIRTPLRRAVAAASCDWCGCRHWRMGSAMSSQSQMANAEVSIRLASSSRRL